MAHVTGGGLPGNLPRVLPDGCRAVIRGGAWPAPPIFAYLQEAGRITTAEMRRVFNMGVGFVCVVPARGTPRARALLARHGVPAWEIGEILRGRRGVSYT
jgi:phosphoribosylformylglycinamidine cyclo-ligase